MLIPQTTPPTSWLVPVVLVDEGADVVGADHAADLHHVGVGVDGYLGEDGSPGVRGEGVAVFGAVSEVAVASTGVLPLRAMRVVMVSDLSGVDLRKSLPSLVSMSSAVAPWSGDCGSAIAS